MFINIRVLKLHSTDWKSSLMCMLYNVLYLGVVDTDCVLRLFEKLSVPFCQVIMLYLLTDTTASTFGNYVISLCFSLDDIQFPRNI